MELISSLVLLMVARGAAMGTYGYDCPREDQRIQNNDVPDVIADRALRTLPAGFEIRPSSVRKAGLGVFSHIFVSSDTWFGPYAGEIVNKANVTSDRDMSYTWAIMQDDDFETVMDGHDVSRSSWLRYVNCAVKPHNLNLEARFCHGTIYYRSITGIIPGQELFVYYGHEYARKLGLPYVLFYRYFKKSTYH